jgi:Tol biopolymer transport system component
MTMRANRAVAGGVVVALLGGWAIAGVPAPTAAQPPAPAPPAEPYRVGYVSTATTTLAQAAGDGAVAALPPGAGGVDADASAGPGGLVWVSGRAAAGDAERDGELWFLRDGAREPVRLTGDEATDSHPALSPDGRTVAFASDRAGTRDLFVLGVDGRGLRQVTSGPAADDSPSWSPDGTRLAFSSTRDDPAGDVYTVPVAGGAPSRLTADPAADTAPAWAPGGARIAFTTTRFHPAGDVVVVADTGGAVTRVVPDPGDSAEPAWSADGTRLAFTTRQADPLGDVRAVTVPGGQVTVVSARPGTGESEPAFRPDGTPVFTELGSGATTDIWSADATGGDRRDLTHRVDANEADPAFAPDGTLLAYTRFGAGESRDARVVVANSDGSAPRLLTGPGEGNGREQHPAWSPDAAMIAFTRTVPDGEGSRDSVRIARAADGFVLGDVPLPPYLSGDDSQPVFSADGRKLTLTRAAHRIAPPGPSRVDPARVEIPVGRGGAARIEKTVQTGKVPAQPDIVLLMDRTSSMGAALKTTQDSLEQVFGTVTRQQPQARFAAAAFGDRTDSADGDNPDGRLFRVQQDFTDQLGPLQQAFGRITPAGGGDPPEDWVFALHRIATGAVGFRPDSSRIVVLVGDAPSHDPSGDPDPAKGVPLDTAIRELTDAGIRVVAVRAANSGGGLDSAGQATKVVAATDGVVTPSTDHTEIANAIVRGIEDLPVSVRPVPRCDPGLTLTFAPDGPRPVPGGTDAQFTETAAVAPAVPPGTVLRCTTEFRLADEGTTRPGYTQDVTVRVEDPAVPLLTVPGVTVPGTGPTAVGYRAAAVDADGRPLEPWCTPLSGSLFPVGATTVTCTATGRNGTATGTAVVAVDPGGGFRRELWQIALTRPAPDRVAAGGQADLSPSFGEVCGTGSEGAAEVSPGGAAIAFEHDHGLLCVAAADGGPARVLVRDAGYVDGPAWSPDGALIAYTSVPGETEPRVAVVPAAGGARQFLVEGPGGAAQPAFQRVPDLAVTATAVPAAIPFEGLTTFEFAITNHGATAAAGAGLFVRPTAGLRPQPVVTTKGTCTPDLVCGFGTLLPDERVRVRFSAVGVTAGTQAATGTTTTADHDADARDDSASAVVTVAGKPAPPVTPGSLSVGVSVSAVPLFVGGGDVVLTYLVHNGAGTPMPAVRLVTRLPPRLPATSVSPGCAPGGAGCALGTLAPGTTAEVRIALAAATAADATVTGTVTTTGPDSDTADDTASARVVIRQPEVVVDPGIGRLGSVSRVQGRGFPPGATVRLAWSAGISATPALAAVAVDGRFEAQFLIFHHDVIGPRTLTVAPVTGPGFGTVGSGPVLVVLRTEQPPFVSRG